MSNCFFKFKKFTVKQDNCAMKVGTDGTLLGAWANGGKRILDIGTGTGLIALMMAQRFESALVTAIDIDSGACSQAESNSAESPYHERIKVVNSSVQDFQDDKYDAIVCNPPYFVDSLKCPDSRRTVARHASELTFQELMSAASRLISYNGEFSMVVPSDVFSVIDGIAHVEGFRCVRKCSVKTVPKKQPKRVLVAYSKRSDFFFENTEECIEDGQGHRSVWYSELTGDFYLDK